jgi:hypothetical protein
MTIITQQPRENKTDAGRGLEGYLSYQQRLALAVA